MKEATITLNVGSAGVVDAIATSQLEPFFSVPRTKRVRWSPLDTTHVVGKAPYLEDKHLSSVRFHIIFTDMGKGSVATIRTEPTGFFLKNKWIVYLLGLMMCCGGVLFPIIGFSILELHFSAVQTDIAHALIS